MKLLCLDIPQTGSSMEKYQPYLLDELRQAWQLYKSGFVREIYLRQDRPGVVIIAECDSVEAARQVVREFPLVKAGLIDWEIIPIGSMVTWEMLFAPENV
jgi:hypothetical protein